tara:strand:- start:5819 stop:6691 length:873 start_codon:yes stop_codon:yes gene_type:complete
MITFKKFFNSIIIYIYKLIKYDKDFYLNANAIKYINRINNFQKLKIEISSRKYVNQSYLGFDINRANEFLNKKFKVDFQKMCLDFGIKIYSDKNPLFLASKEILELQQINDNYISNNLDLFIKKFIPKNYAESFFIKKKLKNLSNLSPHTIFYPWFHKYPQRFQRSGLFGPKDELFIKFISIKIINLIKSIKEYGFIPNDNDKITGYILKYQNDYRFVVTGGSHRCSVIFAFMELYDKKFPNFFVEFDKLRINSGFEIIDVNNINYWPAVKSKYLDKDEALEFLKMFFNK